MRTHITRALVTGILCLTSVLGMRLVYGADDSLTSFPPDSFFLPATSANAGGSWVRVDAQTWMETHPDGRKDSFHIVGRSQLRNVQGTTVQRADGLGVFIPDYVYYAVLRAIQPDSDWLYFRLNPGAAWRKLGEMQNASIIEIGVRDTPNDAMTGRVWIGHKDLLSGKNQPGVPLKIEDALHAGDIVTTGAASSVTLELPWRGLTADEREQSKKLLDAEKQKKPLHASPRVKLDSKTTIEISYVTGTLRVLKGQVWTQDFLVAGEKIKGRNPESVAPPGKDPTLHPPQAIRANSREPIR